MFQSVYVFFQLVAANAVKIESPFPISLETADVKYFEASRKLLDHWFSQHPINLTSERIESLLIETHQKNLRFPSRPITRRVSLANTIAKASNSTLAALSRNFVINLFIS